MATRALLIALALAATTFLFPSAAAADAVNDVTTDSPEILIEIGQTLQMGYTIHSDPSLGCNASPASPTTLRFSPPVSVNIFPAPLTFTACDVPLYISITVSGILDDHMTVTASDSGTHAYVTIHATSHIVTGIAGQFTPPVINAPPNIVKEAASPLGAPVVTAFTATDPNNVASFDCTPTLTVFPLGTTVVTCVAYDNYGNRAQATTNVTVVDTTPPVVQVPPPITVYTAFVTYPTSTKYISGGGLYAKDTVTGTAAVACSPASGSRFPAGVTTVRCSATDAFGNTGYNNFTITVIDITNPTLRISPATVTLEATSPAGAPAAFAPNVTDDIDLHPTYACVAPSGSTFPLGTTLSLCTARDGSGNTASASMTIVVVDTTPPDITVPPTLTAEAWSATGAPVSYVATALDIVDLAVAPACLPATDSIFPIGSTLVTCTVTDAHGNTNSRSFTIRIQDTSPPDIGPLPDITLEATSPAGASVSWAPVTGNDAVGGILPATCTAAPGVFAIGSVLVTCSVADAAGNAASASFTVTVRDTTPPDITIPDVIELEPWGPTGAATWPASATDIVDGTDPVACAPASGSVFPAGDTTVTCTSTDAHGNSISAVLLVRVTPIPLPTLDAAPDRTREATGPAGATASWPAVTGADGLGGSLTATCAPASGSTFPLGSTLVTCSATDTGGRTARVAFHVLVQDTTPPHVAVPASASAITYGAAAVVTFASSATDIVDGADAVTCSPASGSAFAPGDTTVLCASTDAHGNTGVSSFVVHVTQARAPSIGPLSDLAYEATGPAGAPGSWGAPSATDWQGHTLAVACAPPPGTFALGSTLVTCTATDGAGVSASTTFRVIVKDTTPPAIAVPSTVAALTYGPSALVTFATSATDIVDGTDAVTCSPASGDPFAVGDTTVACTARDAAGNLATRTFVVHVTKASPPTIGPFPDLTYEATGPAGAAASWGAVSGRDWQDNTLPATCAPAPGTFALGSTLVTCTVTDAAGVSSSATFRVIVKDTTPPKVTAPASFSAAASNATGGVVRWNASATDLVDGADAVTCVPASGSFLPLGATTVKCTSTDRAGNPATSAFTVTVTSAAPPPPACDDDDDNERDRDSAHASDGWRSSSTRHHEDDAEDGREGSRDHDDDDCDDDGHDEHSSTLTLASVPSQALTATSASGAVATWALPRATGGSGAVTVTCAPASGSTFAVGTTTVTCTARDAKGKTATTTFTIAVKAAPPCTSASFEQPMFTPGHQNEVNRFAQGSTVPVKFTSSCLGADAKKTPKLYYSPWSGGAEKAGTTKASSYTANEFRYLGSKWQYELDTRSIAKGEYKVRIDLDGTTLGYAHLQVV